MATIYNHPDGYKITLRNGLLTASTGEGAFVALPIGPVGMAALGAALIESANNAKHGATSQQAGYALGRELVRELTEFQGHLPDGIVPEESLIALHDKLHAMSKLDNFDFAAGGFASAIIAPLCLGIARRVGHGYGPDDIQF